MENKILKFLEFSLNEAVKKKYEIGTTVWFVAKDVNGAPLYSGAHKVVDNKSKLYKVKGKDYTVEASHKEITDVKPKK